jgi:hypothetical protein
MNSMYGGKGLRPAGGNARGNAAGQFGGDIKPKGYNIGQLQQFDPMQQEQYESLFSHLGPESYLSRLSSGDESLFEEMERPAWRDFQEAQGQLGSRFSQLAPGAMSAQRGSGFKNQAGQLGSDFAMKLQGNRQTLQRQGLKDLYELSDLLLGQRPQERFLEKKQQKPKWWEALLGTASPLAGDIASGTSNNTDNFLKILSGF